MATDIALAEYQHMYAILMAELYKKERSAKEVTEPLWDAMVYAIENVEELDHEEIKEEAKRKVRSYVVRTQKYRDLKNENPDRADKILADLETSISQIVSHLLSIIKGVTKEEAFEKARKIREEVMNKYRKEK